jgi:hypothetical protein
MPAASESASITRFGLHREAHGPSGLCGLSFTPVQAAFVSGPERRNRAGSRRTIYRHSIAIETLSESEEPMKLPVITATAVLCPCCNQNIFTGKVSSRDRTRFAANLRLRGAQYFALASVIDNSSQHPTRGS